MGHGLQLGGVSFIAGLWDKCTFISEMWRSGWDKTGQGGFDSYGSYRLIPASPSPCLCVVVKTDWFFSVLLRTSWGNLTMWVNERLIFTLAWCFCWWFSDVSCCCWGLFRYFYRQNCLWVGPVCSCRTNVSDVQLFMCSLCFFWVFCTNKQLRLTSCVQTLTGWMMGNGFRSFSCTATHSHTRAAILTHVHPWSHGCSLLPSNG